MRDFDETKAAEAIIMFAMTTDGLIEAGMDLRYAYMGLIHATVKFAGPDRLEALIKSIRACHEAQFDGRTHRGLQ